jgi:hypothetical protein
MKLLKPFPGMIVGFLVLVGFLGFWCWLLVVGRWGSTDGLFVDSLYVPSFPSCAFMHPLTHSFTDPSSPTSWLGKGS